MRNSVLPDWISELPLQQQSVLLLGLRGPDGDVKHTPFKRLLRAYRGTVLKAAKYNRTLIWGEAADSFMGLYEIADPGLWGKLIKTFLDDQADASILHHYTHFMHGAEILGYKHPDMNFRLAWMYCYEQFVKRLHLNVETGEEMNKRLSDWGQMYWDSGEISL